MTRKWKTDFAVSRTLPVHTVGTVFITVLILDDLTMCNYVPHLPAQLSSIPLVIVSAAIMPHISHFSHHSSPLTAFTISHFSKLFSRRILTFSPFKLLILLLAFLSFPSPPPLSPTHPLNQSSIPFSFSSPCFHVSNFILPFALFHPPFFSCFLPLVTCVCPLFLLCFSHFPFLFIALLFHPTGSVFIFSSIPRLYHLFPLLDSLPSLVHFPSSVYSLLSCFVLTSVFQAHCLFSVLSETVAEAVRGSYQPQ